MRISVMEGQSKRMSWETRRPGIRASVYSPNPIPDIHWLKLIAAAAPATPQ